MPYVYEILIRRPEPNAVVVYEFGARLNSVSEARALLRSLRKTHEGSHMSFHMVKIFSY